MLINAYSANTIKRSVNHTTYSTTLTTTLKKIIAKNPTQPITTTEMLVLKNKTKKLVLKGMGCTDCEGHNFKGTLNRYIIRGLETLPVYLIGECCGCGNKGISSQCNECKSIGSLHYDEIRDETSCTLCGMVQS